MLASLRGRASGQIRANRPLSLIALQSTAGQREHMTASDKCTNLIKYVLLCKSHPHRIFAAGAAMADLGRRDKAPEIFCANRLDGANGPIRNAMS
jgi:hypothetical protein